MRLPDKEKEKYLDKIRGSLIGGAVGDALGSPVEFLSWNEIRRKYGPDGIRKYMTDFESGEALFSDDTQMTLYTANGLLLGETRGQLRGIMAPPESYIREAYLDWYRAQRDRYCTQRGEVCWLNDREEMHARRAPGNTCLFALEKGGIGSVEHPCNNSKGCGGVMRVAPVGLYYPYRSYDYRLKIDRLGAEAAAITHGHPLGYIPAAMMTHIINIGVYGGCANGETLLDAVLESMSAMRELFPEQKEALDRMEELTNRAIALSAKGGVDEENITALGEGWVAEEALSIALYCCLRYPNDFSKAVIAAVNHSGDSDSTGAITGNILGAWLGYGVIEEKWLFLLEMKSVILELADDLCYGCQMDEYSSFYDPLWEGKYVYGRYAKTDERAMEIIHTKENE